MQSHSPAAVENRVLAILRAETDAAIRTGDTFLADLPEADSKFVKDQWYQAAQWRRDLRQMADGGDRYARVAYEFMMSKNIIDIQLD